MPDHYQEVVIQFVATIFVALLLIGFILIIFQLRAKNRLVQQKEIESIKTAYEKDLLQTRLEIHEETLKNVSMDIHDNIGQVMLLANVNVSILQSMPIPPEAMSLTGETKQLLGKAIDDISQLSRSLHSDRITDMGVFTAIEYELELLSQKGLYTIHFSNDLPDDAIALPKETQLVIFRIYQEVSKNIIKHAQADRLDITVSKKDDVVYLSISDNGKGFDPAGASRNGVGMRSLESRTKLIGGRLEIVSAPGEGTSITIFVPTNEA